MKETESVLLIILDGWGISEKNEFNAIHLAKTPNMDSFEEEYPFTTLVAHNGMVGLPEGQMGNSEVGHLNIGAGRVVYQDFTRINNVIATGKLSENKPFNSIIDKTIEQESALHLLGLLSDGGVHSHIDHLVAMIKIAVEKGLKKVYVHCFMDGRDTPPQSGKKYIEQLQNHLIKIGGGEIATVTGRYYAMDRDNRWDRVEKAWKALVDGSGKQCGDPVQAVQQAYDSGETDEFIKPVNICLDGSPVATINDGDSILFFNFRADRARQMTHAFTDKEFNKFPANKRPTLLEFTTCTRYEKDLTLPVLFPSVELEHILGEEISKNSMNQLRIAETEKYAHVTYFFNGGREDLFEHEDRILVDSPRDVATYDLKPEMSANKLTDVLLERLKEKDYELIVLNYANGDMVGHTGNLSAAIRACETVDSCLGRVVESYKKMGGIVAITADHGNADIMYDKEINGPHTAHTLSPVPFMLISETYKNNSLKNGGALKDIAPTIMTILNLTIPEDMEGESLI